jgi:hypothetical protein
MLFKAQSLPARCEICHQSDLFNGEKNHCRRCADVVTPEIAQKRQLMQARVRRLAFSCSGGAIGSLLLWKNSLPILSDLFSEHLFFIVLGFLIGGSLCLQIDELFFNQRARR